MASADQLCSIKVEADTTDNVTVGHWVGYTVNSVELRGQLTEYDCTCIITTILEI